MGRVGLDIEMLGVRRGSSLHRPGFEGVNCKVLEFGLLPLIDEHSICADLGDTREG